MSNEQTVIIPSDPETREKLRKAVIDVSNQWAIIEGHQAAAKEAIKAIAEDFEMPPKFIKKLVGSYHRQNFETQQTEFDDFADLYEAVFDPAKE